jgi:hypothetical protein
VAAGLVRSARKAGICASGQTDRDGCQVRSGALFLKMEPFLEPQKNTFPWMNVFVSVLSARPLPERPRWRDAPLRFHVEEHVRRWQRVQI